MNLNPFSISHCGGRELGVSVLLCLAGAAQAQLLTVNSLAYNGEMPYVESGNAAVAQRINAIIYLDMLEIPPPAKRQNGLRAKKSDVGVQPVSDLSFEVVRNDARVLALAIGAEGCGAYCEHYTSHFNFDATSGRHLLGADLFTPTGAQTLSQQVAKARIARVNAQIRSMNKRVQKGVSKTQTKEDVAQFADAITMYEDCAAQMSVSDKTPDPKRVLATMKIGQTALTFIGGRCSNHAMRALDDLDTFENTVSLAQLEPHLSAYGKFLLMDGTKADPVGGPFNQILFGTVGSAPITLRLGAPNGDHSVGGLYYYNKYQTPISLSGRVSGNTLELMESASNEQPQPMLRATVSGETLKGQWIGLGKQLPFAATP